MNYANKGDDILLALKDDSDKEIIWYLNNMTNNHMCTKFVCQMDDL